MTGSLTVAVNRIDLSTGKAPSAADSQLDDAVAIEEPLEIQLVSASAAGAAAKSISITMRTPGDDINLALGFLHTEGIIDATHQVVSAQHVGERDANSGRQNTVRITVEAALDLQLERLERHFYTTSSCGVCGKASLEALRVTGLTSLRAEQPRFPAEVICALPDRVRSKQPVFAETGGLHAAAVFDPHGDISVVCEDVGRHNATDKAVGALFSESRLPAHNKGLLVSGRASFELMQKALVAGIPLLAAVGAPSSLAVEMAQEFDLSLIGFLRDGTFNIYAGPERIC